MRTQRITRRRLLRLAGFAGTLTGCSIAGNRAPPTPAAVQLSAVSPTPQPPPTAEPAAATRAVAFATPTFTPGPRSFDIDVLVIGAGMAGLAAARHLKANGVNALTIEARTRIGGRLFTDTKANTPLDLGAGFIQGSIDPDFKRALESAGGELVPWKSSALAVFDAPLNPVSKADEDSARAMLGELRRRMQDGVGKAHPSAAVSDEIANVTKKAGPGPAALSIFNALVAAQLTAPMGEDPERVSLRYYAPPQADVQHWFAPAGLGALAGKLATPIDVRMGWRATRLNHDEGGVEVIGERRSLRARRVIVTVPLGSLQQSRLDFAPMLPAAKTTAYGVMRMGTISKFALRFNRKFWDTDVNTFAVAHEEVTNHAIFWNWHPYSQQNVLMAHAGGRFGRLLESLPQTDAVDLLMAQVRRAYGASAPAPADIFNVRWDTDPFSLGSHCIIPPGATADHVIECAKPVGVIHFAGEHTVREGTGTLMAAWKSGMRAANDVIASLK